MLKYWICDVQILVARKTWPWPCREAQIKVFTHKPVKRFITEHVRLNKTFNFTQLLTFILITPERKKINESRLFVLYSSYISALNKFHILVAVLSIIHIPDDSQICNPIININKSLKCL